MTTLLQVNSFTIDESCGEGKGKPPFSRAASCSLTHGTINSSFVCSRALSSLLSQFVFDGLNRKQRPPTPITLCTPSSYFQLVTALLQFCIKPIFQCFYSRSLRTHWDCSSLIPPTWMNFFQDMSRHIPET